MNSLHIELVPAYSHSYLCSFAKDANSPTLHSGWVSRWNQIENARGSEWYLVLLYLIHYNRVLTDWIIFFSPRTPDSIAWNEYCTLQSQLVICCSPSLLIVWLPAIFKSSWLEELPTFTSSSVAFVTSWEYFKSNFDFVLLLGGVCYCLWQLLRGVIERMKFRSKKQSLNFWTTL